MAQKEEWEQKLDESRKALDAMLDALDEAERVLHGAVTELFKSLPGLRELVVMYANVTCRLAGE
jgi:hypothetical protein